MHMLLTFIILNKLSKIFNYARLINKLQLNVQGNIKNHL